MSDTVDVYAFENHFHGRRCFKEKLNHLTNLDQLYRFTCDLLREDNVLAGVFLPRQYDIIPMHSSTKPEEVYPIQLGDRVLEFNQDTTIAHVRDIISICDILIYPGYTDRLVTLMGQTVFSREQWRYKMHLAEPIYEDGYRLSSVTFEDYQKGVARFLRVLMDHYLIPVMNFQYKIIFPKTAPDVDPKVVYLTKEMYTWKIPVVG